MAERGVDDGRMRYGEHELLEADAWQQLFLRKQTIVCGRVELEDGLQVSVVIADGNQDAVVLRQMPRQDQAMRVELADERDRRRLHPARRASSRRRTVCMAGKPPRIM